MIHFSLGRRHRRQHDPSRSSGRCVDADGNEVGNGPCDDQPEATVASADRRRSQAGTSSVPGPQAGRTDPRRRRRADLVVQPRGPRRRGRSGSTGRSRSISSAPTGPDTPDLALWEVIKLGTEAISFDHYAAWMDYLFCGGELPDVVLSRTAIAEDASRDGLGHGGTPARPGSATRTRRAAPLPFPDIEGYKVLKAATETFLELNCGVVFDEPVFPTMRSLSASDREALGLDSGDTLRSLWQKYLIRAGEARASSPTSTASGRSSATSS